MLESGDSAVAYDQASLQRFVDESGLRLSGPVRLGGWSGYFKVPFDGQDVLIARE